MNHDQYTFLFDIYILVIPIKSALEPWGALYSNILLKEISFIIYFNCITLQIYLKIRL